MIEYKPLSDLCSEVAYGYTDSASDSGNVKFLRITDIVNDRVDWDNVPYCTVSEKEREQYTLQYGDIVVARTGNTTGANYTYVSNVDAVFASYLIRFRINKEIANPLYVGYVLKSSLWWKFINVMIGGSAQKGINANQLGKFKVPLPSLEIQDKVAKELSLIDEKILINSELINNLKELSEMLFHKWFIEFNFPNKDGRPYKENGGTMYEVEGKMIPLGWKFDFITSLGDIVSGGTPSTENEEYFCNSGIPWITPKDLSLTSNKYIERGAIDITDEGLKNSSAKLMPKGTVLMSSRAPIGYLAIAKNEVTTNQGFKSIVPNSNVGSEFIFYTLKRMMPKIERIASGSTFKEVSKEMLSKLKILKPEDTILSKFQEMIQVLAEKTISLEKENELLTETRDLLVEKLISKNRRNVC